MVFKGRIDSDIRARVFYLRHIQSLSVRKVADLCNVSFSSVLRISEEKRAKKITRKTTITTLRRANCWSCHGKGRLTVQRFTILESPFSNVFHEYIALFSTVMTVYNIHLCSVRIFLNS